MNKIIFEDDEVKSEHKVTKELYDDVKFFFWSKVTPDKVIFRNKEQEINEGD